MKKFRQWALLLSTLLLSLLGAALPFAVSAIQDANVENKRENRLLNAVQLTLLRDGGIREKLKLVAEGEQTTLPWTGKTKMTEDEAIGAARKVLDQLLVAEMIPEPNPKRGSKSLAYGTEHIEPRLIFSLDNSRPLAIVWLYVCDREMDTVIYIDDETGQMIRMSVETGAAPETYVSLAESWRVFLSEYYGFALLPDDKEPSEEDNGLRYSFALLLDMGDRQEPCRLNLSFYGNKSLMASFNSFHS